MSVLTQTSPSPSGRGLVAPSGRRSNPVEETPPRIYYDESAYRDEKADELYERAPNTYALYGPFSLGNNVPAKPKAKLEPQCQFEQHPAVFSRKIPNVYNPRTQETWLKDKRYGYNPLNADDQYKAVPIPSQANMNNKHNPKAHPLRSKVPYVSKADVVQQYGVKNIFESDASSLYTIGRAPSIQDALEERGEANQLAASFNSHLQPKAAREKIVRGRALMEYYKQGFSRENILRLKEMTNADDEDTYNFMWKDTDKLRAAIRARNNMSQYKQGNLSGKRSTIPLESEEELKEANKVAKEQGQTINNVLFTSTVAYDKSQQEVKLNGRLVGEPTSVMDSNAQTLESKSFGQPPELRRIAIHSDSRMAG
jgi:hypothetical protein